MTQTTAPTTAPVGQRYDGFDRMLIGGTWRAGRSGTVAPDIDPYTGSTLVEIPLASRDDVDEAYRAAAAAQPAWAATNPGQRQAVVHAAMRVMDARHEEIVDWLVHEAGGTRFKSEFEWGGTLGVLDETASFPYRVHGELRGSDVPGKENRIYRQPLGVVTVISPWNFPLVLSMRSVAPALVLGNAVVLKPASDTPVTGALLIAKIFEEAGLPAGLLNVVVGSGSEIGDYVVEHPTPSLVSFTGSTEVGKHVGALASSGPHLKRVALELGGNAPFVVLDDADIEHAVKSAVFGRFLHQGQICMSTNRIIVDARIHDAFVDAFVERVRGLKVGDPDDPATLVGPIINRSQMRSVLGKVGGARAEGARQLLGGEPTGQVLPPHVFVDVTGEMGLSREETFGPVVPIIKARDEADALRLANDTEYGLSSAVFTGDLERGVAFAQQVQAGMTHVNDITVQDEPFAPFGGEKNSGLGRFHGDWIIEELTRVHWVSVQHTPREYPLI